MSLKIAILLVAFLIGNALTIHVAVRNESKGAYCLLLDSDISGTVQYHDSVLDKIVNYDFLVNGTAVNSNGKCFEIDLKTKETEETVSIHFLPNDITPVPPPQDLWTIHLSFVNPNGSVPETFQISDYQLTAVFYPTHFNATTPTNSSHIVNYNMSSGAEMEWAAKESHGYTCSSASLSLDNSSSLHFHNLKVLAFTLQKEDNFPDNQLFEQCKTDVRTSDLVPIIVGACLAGLVIVVLVAYLIGRARAKRQGYASV